MENTTMRGTMAEKALYVLKRYGLRAFAGRFMNFVFRTTRTQRLQYHLLTAYYRIFKRHLRFEFQNLRLPYFYHRYNLTYNNERAVEIPIARWFIDTYGPNRSILEVGAVLPHYCAFPHDIVDLFEKGETIVNQDIADFHPARTYDVIVSISTLEHVGWDDGSKDPAKLLRAVENLRTIAAPGGIILVTLPLGCNSYMDGLLKRGEMGLTKQFLMKRISYDNQWVEVDARAVADTTFVYNSPYPGANWLLAGIIEKA
ncbi:MAG: hypothetical protein HY770_06515 [Chitinivibrionia bacterium]|nr:hypothetical protein [Chitinivibrionia bacterium]